GAVDSLRSIDTSGREDIDLRESSCYGRRQLARFQLAESHESCVQNPASAVAPLESARPKRRIQGLVQALLQANGSWPANNRRALLPNAAENPNTDQRDKRWPALSQKPRE